MEGVVNKCHYLEVDSVMIDFNGRSVLSDIALSCQTGQVIGLLGRNGSGKSTLLKIIFGSQSTFNKNIRIDGKVVQIPYKDRGKIGYLPQFSFLPSSLSIKQIVRRYIADRNKAKAILKHSSFEFNHNKRIAELSGGERRLFELLFLLAQNYHFLLLDEPFSGIEPKYRKIIIETIDQHKTDTGFIITDHYYQSILESADQILLINEGRCIEISQWDDLERFNYVPKGTFSKQLGEQSFNQVNSFDVDPQTLKDIDIKVDGSPGAVMQLFMEAGSEGGRQLIKRWMSAPTNSLQTLSNRSDAIRFFMDTSIKIELPVKRLKFVHHYMNAGLSPIADHPLDLLLWLIKSKVTDSNEGYLLREGVAAVMEIMESLQGTIGQLKVFNVPAEVSRLIFEINALSQESVFIKKGKNYTALGYVRIHNYFCLRGKDKLDTLLNVFSHLDAYQTVATISKSLNLRFAEYKVSGQPFLEVKGLFHPLVKNAVPNHFVMDEAKHLCFLTGANMSGKSTFLKSVALSIYLAHVGFPVPATSMQISLLNGLLTTINLTDDLVKGYSHFYSEVKRVKEAVLKIKNHKRMLVIFDELFRGTNVKDAADASLMITEALAEIKDTFFMVSTHIVEIADDLKMLNGIGFKCFETQWREGTPHYDYQLKDGVSKERLGLYIVKQEGIMEVLCGD